MRNYPCLLIIRDMYLFPCGPAVPVIEPLTELPEMGGPVFQSTLHASRYVKSDLVNSLSL